MCMHVNECACICSMHLSVEQFSECKFFHWLSVVVSHFLFLFLSTPSSLLPSFPPPPSLWDPPSSLTLPPGPYYIAEGKTVRGRDKTKCRDIKFNLLFGGDCSTQRVSQGLVTSLLILNRFHVSWMGEKGWGGDVCGRSKMRK